MTLLSSEACAVCFALKLGTGKMPWGSCSLHAVGWIARDIAEVRMLQQTQWVKFCCCRVSFKEEAAGTGHSRFM